MWINYYFILRVYTNIINDNIATGFKNTHLRILIKIFVLGKYVQKNPTLNSYIPQTAFIEYKLLISDQINFKMSYTFLKLKIRVAI